MIWLALNGKYLASANHLDVNFVRKSLVASCVFGAQVQKQSHCLQ